MFQARFRWLDFGGDKPRLLQISTRPGEDDDWGPFDTVPPQAIPVVDAQDANAVAFVYPHRRDVH